MTGHDVPLPTVIAVMAILIYVGWTITAVRRHKGD